MIVLETKKITDISGEFIVPSYQRGYRWKEEVTRLLEDIMEIKEQDNYKDYSYCLQPVVVKNLGNNRFELIDGQQRLTTIFLIYKVVAEYLNGLNPNFSLHYETRTRSQEFLENIKTKEAEKEDNIDFFFMWNAYESIQNWIKSKNNPANVAINIYNLLSEKIQIIWYEVDENVDSNLLFQRLNIGKIPLTSAELVKAIFLSENSKNKRKEEIAYQWDSIEKELHDKAFWGFLSNDN